jgi:ribosomal protein S18 acetylase RimI-like enzyme
MEARAAQRSEIDHLARLWHEGWRDGHAHFAPPGLIKARTVDAFAARIAAALPDTFVAGPPDAPAGFFMLREGEIYQFFVARSARGSGFAAALLAAAEAELARRGSACAWLACAVGNDRAARFYAKCGWHNARRQVNRLETAEGVFEVDIWRFEKEIARL